ILTECSRIVTGSISIVSAGERTVFTVIASAAAAAMTVSNPVISVADPAIEYVDLLLQCKELTAIHSLGARLRNFAWLNIREYRALRSAKRKPVFFVAVICNIVQACALFATETNIILRQIVIGDNVCNCSVFIDDMRFL